MIHTNYCRTTTSFISRISIWYHNIANRPKSKHNLLQPSRRKRPYSISTPILIVWTPQSIYSYSARVWNDFSYRDLLFKEKRTIWVYGNSLSYNINCVFKIHHMSPSYIYSQNGCRHTGLLHISHHDHCYPNWSESLQLTSYTSWR